MYDDIDDETVRFLTSRPERQKPRSEQRYEDRHERDLCALLELDDFYGSEEDEYAE